MTKVYLKTISISMYFKEISTKIYDIFTATSFVNKTQDETDIQTELKENIHTMVPLEMEVSSAGIFSCMEWK